MENLLKKQLYEILDLISGIEENLQGLGYEDFRNDRSVKIKVVQSFEGIFSIIKKVSEQDKENLTKINWKLLEDIEKKLFSGSYGIDDETVWKAAKYDLRKQVKFLDEAILLN
jgi:uncharacterized protein with HEPN domain